ncbi:MFS transporter [uncultured Microbacterium sp.]|uniref:MFS transporter n=1 Tax=uncultured Microbacterium sp. TaxID=191216 RepID=UPI0025E7F948|nr:MFS transporter [uncultured Microbacterium sp.]
MSDAAEGSAGPARPAEVLRTPAFALFWSATTLRAFGTAIAGVAFQVLIVTVVGATPLQISILSALSVVPYLFLGLIIGALMDRWRRQPTLVLTSIGRAVVLAAVPVLLLTGTLTFWSLAAVVLLLGILTLFADSAAQPLLPHLVARRSLVVANARLGQSATVAGTAGPALGGTLLTLLGPPALFVIEACLLTVSAVLQSRIRVREERAPKRGRGRHIGHEIAEGWRFTYRHRTLRPLALSVHTWFLAHSIVTTLFGVFTLRELGVTEWAFGLILAAGGIGGFVGALLAPRIGTRLGAGRAILLGRSITVVPWLALAVLPLTAATSLAILLPLLAAVQFVYALSQGIEDANEMGYRQAAAPDALQGRMNSTIRTVNRVVFFVGALLAGVLATLLGSHAAIGIAAVVFAVAALVIVVSPLRRARHDDDHAGAAAIG